MEAQMGIEGAIEKLKSGSIVMFVRKSGKEQVFKQINNVLHELKDGEWKERMYLPRWDDILDGKWIY